MEQNYNKSEHLELLKKKYIFKTIGLNDSKDSKKLFSYSILMNDTINWYFKEIYLELLEDFCQEKTEIFQFSQNVNDRESLIDDIVDKLESNLIILSPTKESIGFTNLLEEFSRASDDYFLNLSPEDKKNEQIPDEEFQVEFKNSVKEIYFKKL